MISLVVVVEDPETGRTDQFAFIKSPVRIGRGELNDLPLTKPFVSTYHGVIQFNDVEASYVDLGSTNGSTVDGVRVDRNVPVTLHSGALLSIGSFRLTFNRRVTGEHLAMPKAITMFEAVRAPRQPTAGRPVAVAVASGELPPSAVAAIAALAHAPSPAAVAPEAPPAAVGIAQPPPVAAYAPPPPVSEPVTAAAQAAAATAIEAASLDLDLHHASYRGSWEYLRNAIEETLAPLDPGARRAALAMLTERYGTLSAEPQFRAMAGLSDPSVQAPPVQATPLLAPFVNGPAAPLPPPPLAPVDGMSLDVMRLLRAFSGAYLPAGETLDGAADVEAMLARVASVLEAFGRSFLELRRGHDEFGKEMGVRTVQEEGALHRARDTSQLLSHLLDPRGEPCDRELQRAFGEFMLHQVALLRGVADGAKALLDRLNPDSISEEAPSGVWPMRAAGLWKAFEQRFHEVADEDGAISESLFGEEFASAYESMVGRREPPGSAGANEQDSPRRKR